MPDHLKLALERLVLSTAMVVNIANELTEVARAVARATVRQHDDAETGGRAAVALADVEASAARVRDLATNALKAAYPHTTSTEHLEPADRTARTAPSEFVISSATVEHRGGFDVLHLWNRGGYAGELIVGHRDGMTIANKLGLFLKPG